MPVAEARAEMVTERVVGCLDAGEAEAVAVVAAPSVDV